MNLWLVSYKQHKVEVCSMYQGESLGFLGGLGVTNNGTPVETIIIVFVWFFMWWKCQFLKETLKKCEGPHSN